MTTQSVPAGWYPDPSAPDMKRWWDGTTWTTHVQPAAPAAPPPPTPPPPPGSIAAARQAIGPSTSTVEPVAELESERERWLQFAKAEYWEMVEAFDSERAALEKQVAAVEAALVDRHERLDLQEMGFFEDGDHPVADSVEFKQAVEVARTRRKAMGQRKDAVLGSTSWTVNGSVTEGRKMVDEFSKLMLRAYNSELDALVKTTNATNSGAKIDALGKKRDQIRKLGRSMNIEIHPEYHDLAVYEIRQTGMFQAAKLREKEAERARREELREQAKVEAELRREQEKLDKEATLYLQALAAMQANPDATPEEVEALRVKIAEVEAAQADVMMRAANTRAGHVYVISNPGAFGDDMVKIGMTRRLEPTDRINELGDASVPFRFSVHALIFSSDAVTLEAELHRRFEAVRVNRVNRRREFFRATPQQVRDTLVDLSAHVVEFAETPTNEEWDASR